MDIREIGERLRARKELIIGATVLIYIAVYAVIGIGGLTFQSQPGFSYIESEGNTVTGGQVWIEGSDLHWTDGSTERWVSKKADLDVAYHFDSGSGSTAQDSSGNNNDGTLTNNAGWTTGQYGSAVTLDGSGDSVAISGHNYNSRSAIDEVTACAWVRTTDGSATIASYDRSEYWRFAIGQCGASSGELAFCTAGQSGEGDDIHDMAGNTAVNDGNWHHVCASFDTHDTDDKKLWIDGSVSSSVNSEPTGNHLGTGMTRYGYVGGNSESGSFNAQNPGNFNGDIDEFRLYNRELSEREVRQLYNGDGTEPAGGSGSAGSIWVEGNSLHWIDQDGYERLYEGTVSGTSSGPAGSAWVEGGYIHYIDQSGQERIINDAS